MNFDLQPVDIDFYLIDGILTNISEKVTAYARQAKLYNPEEKMPESWIEDLKKVLSDYRAGLAMHNADASVVNTIDDFDRKVKDISSASDFAKEADVFVYQINDIKSKIRSGKNDRSSVSMIGIVETVE